LLTFNHLFLGKVIAVSLQTQNDLGSPLNVLGFCNAVAAKTAKSKSREEIIEDQ
jgi:hypothetical protein